MEEQEEYREAALLVGMVTGHQRPKDVEASLVELEELLATAGGYSVGTVVQRRDHPEIATFLGSGKVEEVRDAALDLGADVVVFDDELTPTQVRNLEKLLGLPVQDRTAVILDIFAQHAESDEGKLQVELALARYRLPRLRGQGTTMSQQSGRVGMRQGFGETRLEIDRRRLASRISRLERELKRLTARRDVQRHTSRTSSTPRVALVGYTSAGKSTLLHQLTGAEVLVSPQLFSTLDPRTRKLALPGGREVLVSDTVGFVSKLPHQLVEAFRSTLEVAVEADLLLHVVDCSAADPERQLSTVRETLESIGAGNVPELLVLNKIDLPGTTDAAAALHDDHPGAVAISALTGDGMAKLLEQLDEHLPHGQRIEVLVPWERSELVGMIHREGRILSEEAEAEGTRMEVEVPEHLASRLTTLV